MQLWFWLTPIVYPYEKLAPGAARRSHRLAVPAEPDDTDRAHLPARALPPRRGAVDQLPADPVPRTLPVLPTWAAATYAGLDGLILVGAAVLLVFAVWVFGRLEGNFAEEL